jgi:transcriptional regulator GlxA family with amidase domain
MLGKPARASGKPFETPYLMPLKAGTVEFDRVFLTLCRLIDQFDGQPDALVAMGVSDSFYRAMALLLNQEQLLSTTEERVGGGLDKVCNYIRDHVAESIALTDLETISGLSARALQYAFMKRFNCTPMQWVRQIKAEYARELLRHPNEFITVAAVAVQCGFANFSKFSQFYQSIFHEKPSETLKNALK